MRNQRINYILVGSFTLAMLIGVVASIIMLGGGAGPRDAYHLTLSNVSDIKFGTQVRYEGYPIGQVEAIKPFAEDGKMRFRIDVALTGGWKIPVDSIARIGSSSLLAAKTIDITAGEQVASLSPGQEIPAAPPVDMFSIISSVAAEFGDLSSSSLKPLINDVRKMANRLGGKIESDIATLMGSMNDVAGAMKGRVGEIARNLTTVSVRLANASAGMERLMSKPNVMTAERTLSNIEATTSSFRTTSADLGRTRAEVDALLTDVRKMIADNRGHVDSSLTNVQYTLRSISETIDSVMINLDQTSRNMTEFSRTIRQNPGTLLSSSRPDPVGNGGRRR
jgi:phospholipid/cholesterol/gamma-HCH transport system substrate-binding protein